MNTKIPSSIIVHQQSKVLELGYEDNIVYKLPFEYLRVLSPSAEVRGHGPGQETLQTGKRQVSILSIDQVGNYAIKPTFTDGHDSGLYSWDYLYELCVNQDTWWSEHLAKLEAAGLDRDAPMKK